MKTRFATFLFYNIDKAPFVLCGSRPSTRTKLSVPPALTFVFHNKKKSAGWFFGEMENSLGVLSGFRIVSLSDRVKDDPAFGVQEFGVFLTETALKRVTLRGPTRSLKIDFLNLLYLFLQRICLIA